MIINSSELAELSKELDIFCKKWDSDMLLKALTFLELKKLNHLLTGLAYSKGVHLE